MPLHLALARLILHISGARAALAEAGENLFRGLRCMRLFRPLVERSALSFLFSPLSSLRIFGLSDST